MKKNWQTTRQACRGQAGGLLQSVSRLDGPHLYLRRRWREGALEEQSTVMVTGSQAAAQMTIALEAEGGAGQPTEH